MKFDYEDNGNCRVYYKDQRRVYCFQMDQPGRFTFYRCSTDGEPAWEATPPPDMLPPPGETLVGRELLAQWGDK